MSEVLGIFREELAAGFSLAGVEVTRVHDAGEAREALLAASRGTQFGLVIVDDSLLAELDEKTRRLAGGRSLPLVVPIPGRLLWRDAEELAGRRHGGPADPPRRRLPAEYPVVRVAG